MKLKTKALIDFWIGYPLLVFLNISSFFLGKLLKRNHSFDDPQVIVVCKLMGLGSIIQITPLLASLRKRFPSARLVFLTRAKNMDLCRRFDVIDEIVFIDDYSIARLTVSMFSLLRRFWQLKIDIFVNLEVYSQIGSLLAILSCARNRIGYYLRPDDMRASGIYTHMIYFNQSAPIAQVYLHAARCIDIKELQQHLVLPRIYPFDYISLNEKIVPADSGFDKVDYIIVNPNASELRIERRWPLENYAVLINKLHKLYPHLHVYLIGGPGEEPVGDAIYKLILNPSGWIYDLAGQLSLPEVMALFKNALVFITNDSGPMHLAFALDIPTVALFGPVSPEHYGGIGGGNRILLYRHIYCSPCVHHFLESPCRGDNQCMKLIGVEDVLQAVEKLLNGIGSCQAFTDLRKVHQK